MIGKYISKSQNDFGDPKFETHNQLLFGVSWPAYLNEVAIKKHAHVYSYIYIYMYHRPLGLI